MSSVITPIPTGSHSENGDTHHAHPSYLAHHFDTPEQQTASQKLGMWVFLATEILMFGGLFCAYAVYRHNHPDVFEYAHQYLDKWLGAINTVVLITSSLTMAWGVRFAQLGNNRGLVTMLVLTLLGGFGFLGIKSIEYKAKWQHHLGVGAANKYQEHYKGPEKPELADPAVKLPETPKPTPKAEMPFDPNANGTDAAKIRPTAAAPAGLAREVVEEHKKKTEAELEEEFEALRGMDRRRVSTFFQIYFVMTGLHGLHVLIGMGIIFWALLRALPKASRGGAKLLGLGSVGLFLIYVGLLVGSTGTNVVGGLLMALALVGLVVNAPKARALALEGQGGDFSVEYNSPIDIVGLYWHLVDLIWIFLFPLLYLIH